MRSDETPDPFVVVTLLGINCSLKPASIYCMKLSLNCVVEAVRDNTWWMLLTKAQHLWCYATIWQTMKAKNNKTTFQMFFASDSKGQKLKPRNWAKRWKVKKKGRKKKWKIKRQTSKKYENLEYFNKNVRKQAYYNDRSRVTWTRGHRTPLPLLPTHRRIAA